MKKLVFGVGVNDAWYKVQKNVCGKKIFCPFYQTWQSMLSRCYSKKNHERQPTYVSCTVCDEWLTFSNFRSWMEKQDWQGKQLDKDLIVKGNKVYSQDTCSFVDQTTNSFVTDSAKSRGAWPIGVHYDSERGKFMARCCNPITKKHENLGRYLCEKEAHMAWKKRKHELACILADMQADERVAKSLRTRYL